MLALNNPLSWLPREISHSKTFRPIVGSHRQLTTAMEPGYQSALRRWSHLPSVCLRNYDSSRSHWTITWRPVTLQSVGLEVHHPPSQRQFIPRLWRRMFWFWRRKTCIHRSTWIYRQRQFSLFWQAADLGLERILQSLTISLPSLPLFSSLF